MKGYVQELGRGRVCTGAWSWKGMYGSSVVEGYVQEQGSGRVYTGARSWKDMYRSMVVEGNVQELGRGRVCTYSRKPNFSQLYMVSRELNVNKVEHLMHIYVCIHRDGALRIIMKIHLLQRFYLMITIRIQTQKRVKILTIVYLFS